MVCGEYLRQSRARVSVRRVKNAVFFFPQHPIATKSPVEPIFTRKYTGVLRVFSYIMAPLRCPESIHGPCRPHPQRPASSNDDAPGRCVPHSARAIPGWRLHSTRSTAHAGSVAPTTFRELRRATSPRVFVVPQDLPAALPSANSHAHPHGRKTLRV